MIRRIRYTIFIHLVFDRMSRRICFDNKIAIIILIAIVCLSAIVLLYAELSVLDHIGELGKLFCQTFSVKPIDFTQFLNRAVFGKILFRYAKA